MLCNYESATLINKVPYDLELPIAKTLLICQEQYSIFRYILKLLIEEYVEKQSSLNQRLGCQHKAFRRPIFIESHAGEGVEQCHIGNTCDPAVEIEILVKETNVLSRLGRKIGDGIDNSYHPQALAIVGHGFGHLQQASGVFLVSPIAIGAPGITKNPPVQPRCCLERPDLRYEYASVTVAVFPSSLQAASTSLNNRG